MKKRVLRIIPILALGLFLFIVCSQSSTGVVSEYFDYAGSLENEYKSYTKTSQYVEMLDGTKLAVDVYLPADGAEDADSFPVIFQFTPYGRAYVIPDGESHSLLHRVLYKLYLGTGGRIWDRANSHDTCYGSNDYGIREFLAQGYAYVCADMRGCGASYGSKVDFTSKFASDGAELVEWMAEQDWCDGNVGMFGGSYLGYTALVTAEQQPEALKCIIPEDTAFDGYTGEIRPGGIFLWSYSQEDMQTLLEYNEYLPDEYSYPTAPAVDEDGDGSYSDEVPLDLDGDGSFLDDYNYPEDPDDEPQYADGNEREHIYYLATKEHLDNYAYSDVGLNIEYMDSEWEYEGETLTPYTASPSGNVEALMESGIAILDLGQWMDAFVRSTTELYCTLEETNPSHMVIGVGYHEETSPFWEYLGENETAQRKALYSMRLKFYDYYLKGVDNGYADEDPILIYNMNGDGWRTESEWPLARQVLTDYYFGEDNVLSTETTASGLDKYKVDFTTSSVYGEEEEGTRFTMSTPDELPYRTEEDEKCLTYTTDVLEEDTEVTGHPIVDLWVSSTADTGDFYVYLEDIDEDGNAVLVTENVINAEFAALVDNDEEVRGGDSDVEVLPELPWHGYETSDENTEVFADSAIVEIELDLMPTSWTFQEGHRMRISIACADWPTFELTPELSPSNDPEAEDNIVPTITVYRDEEHASKVTLPVIPAE